MIHCADQINSGDININRCNFLLHRQENETESKAHLVIFCIPVLQMKERLKTKHKGDIIKFPHCYRLFSLYNVSDQFCMVFFSY